MNNMIQGLYDAAAGVPDANGISKLDEQQLRRKLDNSSMGRQNKDIFEEGEPRFTTCLRYNPCPVCYKCKSKASHLFIDCEMCKIPTCAHTHENITAMIKRKNYTHYVSKETITMLKEKAKEVLDAGR